VLGILDFRAYVRLKAQYDNPKTANDVPDGALADLMREITVELWQERKAKRRGR
jgi:hypothetical protein